MSNLLLIDGTALVFRGYYALPPLKTSQDIPVNAVLGFFNILVQLLLDRKPEYFAICFDRSEPTHRKIEYPEYKANRKKAPDDLYTQITLVRKILNDAKINYIDSPGFEADDIIATLSKNADKLNIQIYSQDFDLMQLISKNITVLKPNKSPQKYEEIDLHKFQEKYQILPSQVADYKGLAGDSSDNIPGVPGVGQKTATKLILEYQNLENILDNTDKIKGSLSQKLSDNKELAILSKKLASLHFNVPNLDYTKFSCDNIEYQKLTDDISELELKTLTKKIQNLQDTLNKNITVNTQESLF